jgi:hypothetical protein
VNNEQRIRKLEAEVKHLKRRVAYYRTQYQWIREQLDLIKEAWSVVHPVDVAYMRQAELELPHLDTYNVLLYSFGRALPDGRCVTRLSSFEKAEDYRRTKLREAMHGGN